MKQSHFIVHFQMNRKRRKNHLPFPIDYTPYYYPPERFFYSATQREYVLQRYPDQIYNPLYEHFRPITPINVVHRSEIRNDGKPMFLSLELIEHIYIYIISTLFFFLIRLSCFFSALSKTNRSLDFFSQTRFKCVLFLLASNRRHGYFLMMSDD